MNKFYIALVAVVAIALAVPVSAQQCVPTTSNPEVTQEVAGKTFYVDNDECGNQCLFSIWIYEEDNGIKGLQRNDSFKDDTCKGQIPSDLIIF